MGDNHEQEAADLAAIHNDDDGNIVVVVRYLGGRLDNQYNDENYPRPPGVPDYHIPADTLIRLMIDASVTKIDNKACYECIAVTEVVFHNKVITIGRCAFSRCSTLERIELPAGLLRLERDAFYGCPSLRGEIVIPATVQYMGDAVFLGCTSLESVVFAPTTNVVQLGNRMFRNCSILRFVTLPHNLLLIPWGCFRDCTSLTHLQIPVSVTEMGGEAFASSGIQAMNISVGDDFMPGTIILPPKLRSISGRCFEDCKSLTHIRIPASVQSIGEDALNGSGLRLVEIPKRVQQIRSRAFKNCTYLERVTIYSTNLNLGPGKTNIFVNCPRLSTIMIAPWLWPKLFVSMSEHPQFIFQFFRHYHTKILDFETPDVRLFRQVRRDRKRTATMIDDG